VTDALCPGRSKGLCDVSLLKKTLTWRQGSDVAATATKVDPTRTVLVRRGPSAYRRWGPDHTDYMQNSQQKETRVVYASILQLTGLLASSCACRDVWARPAGSISKIISNRLSLAEGLISARLRAPLSRSDLSSPRRSMDHMETQLMPVPGSRSCGGLGPPLAHSIPCYFEGTRSSRPTRVMSLRLNDHHRQHLLLPTARQPSHIGSFTTAADEPRPR
jgi:hypothetical protein